MATITTRSGKGSPLTSTEVDSNFTNLNTDKAELSGAAFTGAITTNSTFDGRDVATDGTKLDGIESGATADQTAAQIKTAYESNSDTNAFTDADHSKLDGIEASADVTDTANVTAAGALMDSELTAIASVKALNQGVATTDSPTFVDVTATSLDISGNIDVDGTTNLDVVDIDGAVDMASTLAVGGVVTANAGVVVDNITIDGTEIDLSSGDLTLDVAGNISLDADDSGQVRFKDGGAEYISIYQSSSDAILQSSIQDKDIIFKGNDGGSTITALTLDMSEAGDATFNNFVTANRFYVPDSGLFIAGGGGDLKLSSDGTNGLIETVHGNLTLDVAGEIHLDSDSGIIRVRDSGGDYGMFQISNSDFIVRSMVSDKDLLFKGNDNGSVITALTLDMSNAGAATFNAGVTASHVNVGGGTVADPTVTIDSASGGDPTLVFDTGATNRSAIIRFKDQGATSGFINYHHQYDRMDFGTGSSTGITMSLKGGNLLVGKTSANNGTVGIQAMATGDINATVSNDTVARFNRLSGNGEILRFQKDTATVGSIGTAASSIYLGGSSNGGIYINGQTDIRPWNTSSQANLDNSMSLGSTSARFKDLHLSGYSCVNDRVVGANNLVLVTHDSNEKIHMDASGFIKFETAGVERLRINNNGNVGIGTSSPNQGSSGTQHSVLTVKGSGSLGNGIFELIQKGTTANNQTLGDIKFFDNTNHNVSIEAIRATSTDSGTLAFKTRAASGSLAERMRIDSTGRVGIGRTPSISSSKLEVGGADNVSLINVEASGVTGGMGIGSTGLQFFHGSSAKMRIDSSGNVGIGTSSPNYNLHVTGSGDTIAAVTAGASSVAGLNLGNSTTKADGGIRYDNAADALFFRASNTERMRIDSAGNVGIGVTNVGAPLDIGSASPKIRLTDTGGGYSEIRGNGGVMTLTADAGNTVANSAVTFETDGTERMRINSSGSLLVGSSSFSFAGSNDCVQISGTEGRINIENDTASTAYALAFYNTNGLVGRISTSGSATSYVTSSDYRLKEDWQPVENATDRLKELKPCNFAWKADGSRVDGFLAHELQEVVPEAVTGEKDAMTTEEYEVTPAVYEDVVIPATEEVLDEEGNVITEAQEERTEQQLVSEAVMGEREVPDYQGIDQSKLVPLLVATIQELEARITQLENN